MCSRLGWSLAAVLSVSAVTAGCGDNEPLGPTPPDPFAVGAVSPTAGFAGQTVTVTGSGFLPGASVTFGETQAVSTVVTSTRISATVPTLPIHDRNACHRQPNGLAHRESSNRWTRRQFDR